MRKIINFEELQPLRFNQTTPAQKIVHCHGVFDVLHHGHIEYFKEAKAYGDILVVSLTADRFVNKGPGRPYFNENIRANVLANLEIVDFVVISPYPTAVEVLQKLKPDFYVKGPDYRDKTKDVTKEIYNEEEAVKAGGGILSFTTGETNSSTKLINSFFNVWSETQQKTINEVKSIGGLSYISECLEKISKLKVSILGEPILDVYRFCNPQGISSKSPSISAEFLYEEKYEGGAWAINKHLKTFVGERNFYEHKEFIHNLPQKIRYIAVDKSQRIFEVTKINENTWDHEGTAKWLRKVDKKSDLFIFADFGHGLFDKTILDLELVAPIALNVQTNSSNFGFNPFTKHKKFSYLSLDIREAQIAFHDRKSPALELLNKTRLTTDASISLTLGKNGAYYNEEFSPAFSDVVVDATGAGDAYFAITCLFNHIGAKPQVVPFIGNVFAGLKTKIIGNKEPVTKAQFLKAIDAILK